MKKLIALAIIGTFILETSCRYSPPSQTWQPKTHGLINTKRPRAYR